MSFKNCDCHSCQKVISKDKELKKEIKVLKRLVKAQAARMTAYRTGNTQSLPKYAFNYIDEALTFYGVTTVSCIK